jgi:hypothetical protein
MARDGAVVIVSTAACQRASSRARRPEAWRRLAAVDQLSAAGRSGELRQRVVHALGGGVAAEFRGSLVRHAEVGAFLKVQSGARKRTYQRR